MSTQRKQEKSETKSLLKLLANVSRWNVLFIMPNMSSFFLSANHLHNIFAECCGCKQSLFFCSQTKKFSFCSKVIYRDSSELSNNVWLLLWNQCVSSPSLGTWLQLFKGSERCRVKATAFSCKVSFDTICEIFKLHKFSEALQPLGVLNTWLLIRRVSCHTCSSQQTQKSLHSLIKGPASSTEDVSHITCKRVSTGSQMLCCFPCIEQNKPSKQKRNHG